MIDLIAKALGTIIRLIYNMVGQSYGLSIILFTIVTKLLLFPMNYKQARSMKDIQKLAPLEKQIREKYKSNKEKQAEELAKIYQEYKVNPLSGCLPILIQFPIIIAMLYIVKQPLTYILNLPIETVTEYTKEYLNTEEVSKAEIKNNEIVIASTKGLIDMNFCGIDFGSIPSNAFNSESIVKTSKWTILIPILSVILQWLQVYISQRKSTLTEEQKQQQKSMNIMLPFLSGYIAYIMPLALGVYWLLGSLLGIISQLIIDKLLKEKYVLLESKNKGE